MLNPDEDLAYVDIAGLEAHIMSAIRTRNAAALDAVLADDFLYRSRTEQARLMAEFRARPTEPVQAMAAE